MNLKIEKSLARPSELLVKLSPKGKSSNLCTTCRMLKLFWGREEEHGEGRRGGEGGNECLGRFFFFVIFGLTIMATVYKGND